MLEEREVEAERDGRAEPLEAAEAFDVFLPHRAVVADQNEAVGVQRSLHSREDLERAVIEQDLPRPPRELERLVEERDRAGRHAPERRLELEERQQRDEFQEVRRTRRGCERRDVVRRPRRVLGDEARVGGEVRPHLQLLRTDGPVPHDARGQDVEDVVGEHRAQLPRKGREAVRESRVEGFRPHVLPVRGEEAPLAPLCGGGRRAVRDDVGQALVEVLAVRVAEIPEEVEEVACEEAGPGADLEDREGGRKRLRLEAVLKKTTATSAESLPLLLIRNGTSLSTNGSSPPSSQRVRAMLHSRLSLRGRYS